MDFLRVIIFAGMAQLMSKYEPKHFLGVNDTFFCADLCSLPIQYVSQFLYWLPGTSIRKIDNLGFYHPPLYLCLVVLSHRCSRAMFLMHERKREKHALICSIHSGRPCKGRMRGLPKAPSYMTMLAGCTSSTGSTLEHVVPIQATLW